MLPTQDAVCDLIAKHGLEAHHELILTNLAPAIRLAGAAVQSISTGASKLGGEPDLPSPDAWPTNKGRPLHFLAQINLADSPRGWTPSLPERGRLWFWYDTIGSRIWANNPNGEMIADGLSSPGMHQVTFDPDANARLTRTPFPEFEIKLKMDIGEPWRPFPERALAPEPIFSMHHDAIRQLMAAADESKRRDEWKRAMAFLHDLHRETKDGNHRLLGGVDEAQSDLRLECQAITHGLSPYLSETHPDYPKVEALEHGKTDWIMLAMLDSDDAVEWCWGDAGTLYYFIRKEDLARRRFSAVHGIWEQD